MNKFFLIVCFFCLQLLIPHSIFNTVETDMVSNQNKYQETVVSWYGKKFEGRKTASGEIFCVEEISAAHKSLPFGSLVLFVDPKNKKSLIVEINDRGPFVKGRDLIYRKKPLNYWELKKQE